MIIRVFPRKTRATPDDSMAFFAEPPLLDMPKADEVHVSVAFTYDIPYAEYLVKQWEMTGLPVKIGGPAYNSASGEFEPGKYIKPGYTITSRGCPNKCWFCSVPKREPVVRELEIKDGQNILDDNILACSEKHIRAVFAMLRKYKGVEFTGGLEAALLKDWHIDELLTLSVKQMFFAYDGPEDYEPLKQAAKLLNRGGFGRNKRRCYVLMGYPKDTIEQAETRLRECWSWGYLPMAMVWRSKTGERTREWMRFAKPWCRPAATKAMMKQYESRRENESNNRKERPRPGCITHQGNC